MQKLPKLATGYCVEKLQIYKETSISIKTICGDAVLYFDSQALIYFFHIQG